MALKLIIITLLAVVLHLSVTGGDVIPKVLNTRNLMELAAPVSQKVQNEKCRNHSEIYLRDLKMLKLWAAEMFDATSKFPSGILSGSTYGMGNFDECLKVKVPLKDDSFSGKYCLTTLKVQLDADFEENNEERYLLESEDRTENFNVSVWKRIVVLSKDRSKRQRNEIKWSFCIPSSCSAEDLHVHLKEVTDTFNALEDFKVIPHVDEINCHVSNDLAIDGADIAFIVFIVLVVSVALIATGYDFYVKSTIDRKHFDAAQRKLTLWKSFSLISNLKKLARRSSNSDGLDCLHGVKVFSMFLIIMGHRFMFNLGAPIVNSDYIESFYGKFGVTILLNGPIIVDSFFVISGFLACFLLLTEYKKREHSISFVKLYLHRLLRLLPSYAVVIAFYCTLLAKVGSGPLWKEKILIERERCRASWWANLLFVNNYVQTDKICMFQSWFITCDMHFFIITPFIVWLLWKKPKQGLMTLIFLSVLSIASTYVTVFIKRLDGILILYMKLLADPTTDKSFINVYIPTHTRATPYLIGMLAGYVKYKIKHSDFKFSRKIIVPAWTISVVLMLVTIYSAYFFYIPGRTYDVHASAIYASFHRLVWSACISWSILALSTGYGSWIEPILSWKGLTPLSRITYCAFLCHGGIQLYTTAVSRQPLYISIFSLTWHALGDIALAYVLGLILSLLFESPVAGIEKLIFQKKPKVMPITKDLENNHIVAVPDLKATSAA